MSVTPVDLDDDATTTPPPVPSGRRSATWGLTWHGVRTVAALELRQRVRSTRWVVALVVWFLVVGALTLLITGAIGTIDEEGLGKLAAFAGVREFPVRVKCASLAWHTLKAALADSHETAKTE